MEITKYYCDKCEIEVGAHGDLTPVHLSVLLDGRKLQCRKEICDSCMASFGFEEHEKDDMYIGNYVNTEINFF